MKLEDNEQYLATNNNYLKHMSLLSINNINYNLISQNIYYIHQITAIVYASKPHKIIPNFPASPYIQFKALVITWVNKHGKA